MEDVITRRGHALVSMYVVGVFISVDKFGYLNPIITVVTCMLIGCIFMYKSTGKDCRIPAAFKILAWRQNDISVDVIILRARPFSLEKTTDIQSQTH